MTLHLPSDVCVTVHRAGTADFFSYRLKQLASFFPAHRFFEGSVLREPVLHPPLLLG